MADEKTRFEKQEEQRAAREKFAEERAARDRRLRTALDVVLKTPEGKIIFADLHNLCGWAAAAIPQDAVNHVNTGVLLFDTTRRAIYNRYRRLATRSLIAAVEEAAENDSLFNDSLVATPEPEEAP